MKYPFVSLSASLLFWMIILVCFGIIFYQPSYKSLNIDADSISITMQTEKNQPSKAITQKPAKEKTKSDNNISTQQSPIPSITKSDINGAIPIYQPLPEIPDDLRMEAFSTFAIAHFDIAADGSVTVKLIKPCENPRLNYLLLKNLKKWKFSPARNNKGEAISSVQDIKIDFKVE